MQPASDVWFPSSHELKSRDRDTPGVTRPGVTVVLTGHAQRDLFPPAAGTEHQRTPSAGLGGAELQAPCPSQGPRFGLAGPEGSAVTLWTSPPHS